MNDHREKMSYWENRRHENAHVSNQGCVGPLFLVMLLLLAAPPLFVIVADFYSQLVCAKFHGKSCTDQHLIEWFTK